MNRPKILVAFYSRKSSTETLALAVAEGAREASAEVRLRRAREMVGSEVMAQVPGWSDAAAEMNAKYPAPTAEDATWADAIIFGTPTRFGNVSSELKAYIDSLGGVWFEGKLNGKLGSVFGATSSKHGGNESTLVSLYNVLAHLGLIIVPLGYSDPVLFEGGTPYGATFVSQHDKVMPGEHDLAVARYQGKRVASIAGRMASAAA